MVELAVHQWFENRISCQLAREIRGSFLVEIKHNDTPRQFILWRMIIQNGMRRDEGHSPCD
jgi:hypothetical protein